MKPLIPSVFSAFFLCLVFSCNKNKPAAPVVAPPVSPGTPADSTRSVNLTFPYTDSFPSFAKNFELIISEANGRILLDTVAPLNVPILATLKTNQSLVDVTTVNQDLTDGLYRINVYKAVQPWNWATVSPSYLPPTTIPPSSPGRVIYTNVPPVGIGGFEFGSYYSLGTGSDLDSYGLGENYPYYPNDIIYLAVPTLGLYKYHLATSNIDTVDLSQMDTTVNVRFSEPAGYTYIATTLNGIADTTNESKSLCFSFMQTPNQLADLEYPAKKLVQKYALSVIGFSINNENAYYTEYSDTVSTTLPFPTASSYTLSSTQNNNFTFNFNSVSPLYHETIWAVGKIYMIIDAPADSTTLQPLNLLNSLKSKLLQGQTTSGLTLKAFGFQVVKGANYESYFSAECNPAVPAKLWPSTIYYSISL